MTRRLALAAGGTGGHMFPAQSLASEMQSRGWAITLLTDARGMRYAADFPADDIVTLAAANPNVRGLAAKGTMALAMGRGVLSARNALTRRRPQFVMGFGGYPSAPGLFAARIAGLPYGVHEQNAVLGRVNRRAAPGAAFVAHGFAQLSRLPAVRGEVIQTGNPVRAAVVEAAKIPFDPPAADGPLNLLVFGGSQGASLFGKMVPPALSALPPDIRARLSVVQQVTEGEEAPVRAAYAEAGIQASLAPFFTDLPQQIARAHYVIARAGASSVTELSVIGRPALFIPLGIAMDDHQRGNAQVLVEAGAADMILEAELTPAAITALLSPRFADSAGLAKAAAAAKGRAPDDAAERLADLVEDLLDA